MRKTLLYLGVILVCFSCKEPEARRPKTKSTTNFYKELIASNKKLIDEENQFIKTYLEKDTLVYKNSKAGFWYTYNTKVEENLPQPKSNDVVEIDFNITDLQGSVIYPMQNRKHKIDKEDFIPALQDGIKLMKTGETITFVIPSYRGFEIAGDGNKINGNQTIKSTVTLINIKSENENK